MNSEGAAWDDLLTKYADHPAIQRIDAGIAQLPAKLEESLRKNAQIKQQFDRHMTAAGEQVASARELVTEARAAVQNIERLLRRVEELNAANRQAIEEYLNTSLNWDRIAVPSSENTDESSDE